MSISLPTSCKTKASISGLTVPILRYGVDWWDAIVAGLKGAGASVVVMTPEAKASEWVKREVFLALDWKKPLFPLLLNGDNWELFVTTQYCKVALEQLHHPTRQGP